MNKNFEYSTHTYDSYIICHLHHMEGKEGGQNYYEIFFIGTFLNKTR